MTLNSTKKSQIDKLPLLIMVLAPSVRLMVPSANALVLYFLIPVLCIWAYHKHPNLVKSKSLKYYLYFLIWLAITVFFSTDKTLSISVMKTISAGILASLIMYVMAAAKFKNGLYILLSYILLLASTIFYLWNEGELVNLDIYSERLDDSLVNANDLAYYLFYVSCGITILFYHSNIGKFWKLSIYVSLVVFTVWLSLITASRQMLVVIVPYILLCLFFQFFNKGRIKLENIIPVIIVVAILLIPAYYYVEELAEGTFLEERMGMRVSEDTRSTLLQEALRVGTEHPIVGVGPGCFVKFSSDGGFAHNSYAELFATSGIPAVFIYLLMTVPAILINKRRYKATYNPEFAFLYITCLFWLLYNVLYAFYTSLWLISFYFLLMGISDSLYKCKSPKLIVK